MAAGKDPASILLVAVTKGHPWSESSFLYEEGQRDFGENRVVVALEKTLDAPSDCRWHLIGTLQSNKVRKAIGKFHLIHSVDSLELLKRISEVSLELGVETQVLLQANTSKEASKHGLFPEDWKRCFAEAAVLRGVVLKGMMTMAPDISDPVAIGKCFSRLRKLRDELEDASDGRIKLPELSMGMSNDFKLAIAEGATILRIGRLLY